MEGEGLSEEPPLYKVNQDALNVSGIGIPEAGEKTVSAFPGTVSQIIFLYLTKVWL